MKRASKLIIAAATAALTFGSLVAIQGPKDWSYYPGHHHRWHQHDDCKQQDQNNQDDKTAPLEEGDSSA